MLVIGAGIIGASIAWRLAQANVPVRLCDAGRFGGEASWAGAGMLAPGSEFDAPSIWTELAAASMLLYPAFVDELRSESGLPIDYAICGANASGVVYPADGFVDPRDVLRALRSVLERRGVPIHEQAPVAEFRTDTERAVVLAAGAWSSQILLRHRGQAVPVPESFPVKGHLIGYYRRPGSLGPIRRSGHTYILQRTTGLVIAGSTEERAGFNRKIDPRICHRIHKRAQLLWPELQGKLYDECWIGFRPATLTGVPAMGRVPHTNVWLAYGHYRNGILLAPVTADRIARDITASSGTD